jgi:hypothetical protein
MPFLVGRIDPAKSEADYNLPAGRVTFGGSLAMAAFDVIDEPDQALN